MRIKITLGETVLYARLYDTRTAKKIFEILPYRSTYNRWGDEIYFPVPVEEELDETAKEEVQIGDIGYWPKGKAFCIFFGETPISKQGKIIPASAVNIIGKIEGDATVLKSAKGKEIVIERC